MRRRESAALLVAPLLVVLLAAASEAITTAQLTADLLAEPKYAIHFAKAPLLDTDVTDDLLVRLP